MEGSAICQCVAGYYRNDNPQEGPETSCSRKEKKNYFNFFIDCYCCIAIRRRYHCGLKYEALGCVIVA